MDEDEWAALHPLLSFSDEENRSRRDRYGVAALAKYHEFTGFEETNANALWHHRASLYGPPCSACGKPLRTPQANFCAACGKVRE